MAKIINIGLEGTQHMYTEEENYNLKLKKIYNQLLQSKYKNSTIGDEIKSKSLTISRAYVGTEYYSANTSNKIMIVGRAMNGWTNFDDCQSNEEILNKLFKDNDHNPFCDVVNSKGNPYKITENGEEIEKKYFYSRSKFWKLLKELLICFKEENSSPCFYDNDKKWNQKFVWSNLYKVSPANYGNPNLIQIKLQIDLCVEILKYEIEYYKPDYILFITDEWYLNPIDNDIKYFKTIVSAPKKSNSNIVCKSIYNKAKIIVCKRPELLGNEKIKAMAEEIHTAFTKENNYVSI